MKGMSDKISGKSKHVMGKVTDDKKLQAKGKAQETKGKLKNAVDDIRNEMRDR